VTKEAEKRASDDNAAARRETWSGALIRERAFDKGDRVAWHAEFAAQFPAGAVVLESAAVSRGSQLGTVQDVANDENTYFDVKFDDKKIGDKGVLTLTADELVLVQPDVE
jgi:hypothetical protein